MYDAAMIACFVALMYLGSQLIHSMDELRQIKRAKLVRAIRNHPSGRSN